jgi:hypothetical protein
MFSSLLQYFFLYVLDGKLTMAEAARFGANAGAHAGAHAGANADDDGAATGTVYARAVFTVPLARNNTLFCIEFADHANERPHPHFRVIFRQANEAGTLASRAAAQPFLGNDGKLVIIGTAAGLSPGTAYTLIVRDARADDHDGNDEDDVRAVAYAPQTYRVVSVSVA